MSVKSAGIPFNLFIFTPWERFTYGLEASMLPDWVGLATAGGQQRYLFFEQV